MSVAIYGYIHVVHVGALMVAIYGYIHVVHVGALMVAIYGYIHVVHVGALNQIIKRFRLNKKDYVPKVCFAVFAGSMAILCLE